MKHRNRAEFPAFIGRGTIFRQETEMTKNGVIKGLALALGLGIAPVVALAQDPPIKKPEGQVDADVDAQAQTTVKPPEAEGEVGGGATGGEQPAAQQPPVEEPATDGGTDDDAADGDDRDQPTEQAPETQEPPAGEQPPADGDAADDDAPPADDSADDAPPADDSADDAGADDSDDDASAGGAAAVEITEEQETELRSFWRDWEDYDDVERVDIDIDIEIGASIPATVVHYPLPPRVIEIVPAYAGYHYIILVDGTIVIIEPDTLVIVYVIVV
jgi:hypothetical protein